MGKREVFKRVMSLFLSIAMAVTLLPVQMAFAQNDIAQGSGARIVTPDEVILENGNTFPEKLAYFSFDENAQEGGNSQAAVVGTPAIEEGKKGKALKLTGSEYLTITDKTTGKSPLVGKEALTISYWSKSESDGSGNGWAYFIKKDDTSNNEENLSYIASWDKETSLTTQRFPEKGRPKEGTLDAKATWAKGSWKMVTVVLTSDATTLYINGKYDNQVSKQVNLSEILKDTSIFRIGRANWGNGELYKGLIDEFTVYGGALDKAQVEALYYKDDPAACQAYKEQVGKNGFLQTADTLSMGVGESESIKFLDTVSKMSELEILEFSCRTSDSAVASVDASGKITGRKKGTAVITLSFEGYTKEIRVTVKNREDELSPIAKYQFEGSLGEGVKKYKTASHLETYTGSEVYDDNGRNGTKAIKMNRDYGLELKEKNLGTNYTVSLWVKPGKNLDNNEQCLFLGYHDPENWLGITGAGNGDYKAWAHNSLGWNERNEEGALRNPVAVPKDAWTMLTVAQEGNTVRVYKNGKLTAVLTENITETMNGINQGIYVGVNWWDPAFTGLIDDVYVYDTALDEKQVAAVFLNDGSADSLGMLNGNESLDQVTENLTLPTEVNGIEITWTTSAAEKITETGEVKAQDGSKVMLTAQASVPELNFSWKKEFQVTLAREVTVNHIDLSDDTLIASKTKKLYLKEGEKYTYSDIEDVIATDDAAYQYVKESEKNHLSITVGAQDAVITVAYKKLSISKMEPLEDLYVIEGNVPVLPQTANAIVSADDGAEEGTGGSASSEVKIKIPVTWAKTPDITDLEAGKTHTVTGNAGGKAVNVKVTVYECDEDIGTTEASDVTVIKFKDNRIYKGKIVAEYDIVPNSPLSTGDMTVIYTDDSETAGGNVWGKSGPRLDFGGATAYFRTQNGNGSGTSTGNYPGSSYQEGYLKCEVGKVYRVRVEIDDSIEGGRYKTYITEPDGTATKLFEGDGNTFRTYTGKGIQNFAAARSGFKMTNHKIYWQEGYATKKVEIYVGNELKSTLTSKEMEGAYTYKPENTFEIEGDDNLYVLELEKSGWAGSDGNVVPDLDEEGNNGTKESPNAAAGQTVTYKAYYVLKANIKGLEDAIADAKKVKADAADAKIYTDDSLTVLQGRIDTAEHVLNINKTADLEDPAVIKAVKEAIDTLSAEQIEKILKPKSMDQLAEYLNVYYKLEESISEGEGESAVKKVKDESGKGKDGIVHGNVTVDRDNGAVLPGSSKSRTNYIEVPNSIDVSNRMTFSFWVYREAGVSGQHNTFGLSSGEKVADNSTAAVTGHHFSIYAGRNGKLEADAGKDAWRGVKGIASSGFKTGKWHLVTCVVDGTTCRLYDDGELAEQGEIGISLSDAWNADEATRHIFIGNNVYSYNNDPDYKGRIKSFRIYNAPFAAEQVKELYDMEVEIPMQNAVADLLEAIGAREEEGKYINEILGSDATVDIVLPETGKQGESIEWKAYEADGTTESSDVINVAEKKVTMPQTIGTTVKAILKAVITLGESTKTITIEYEITKVVDLDRSELEKSLKAAEKLDASIYTKSSWTAFQNVLKEVRDANKTAATQADIANAKKRLDDAMKTDGTGTLVLLGDKSELNKSISNAVKVMEGRDESDYTGTYEAVWNTLETKLAAANTVKDSDDVSQSQVDTAKDELDAAVKELVNATLEMKIASANAAKQGKNESDYPVSVWKELTEAIEEAETLLENEESSQEEKLAACDRLDAAVTAFKPIDKAAAEALREEAEAAMEGKDKSHYVEEVWEELEAAIAAYKELPVDADRDALVEAYNRLQTALANFKPIEKETVEALKTQAEAAMEGKNKADYEASVWAELEDAIAAYKNLPENADSAAIIEAYHRLHAALKNFVPRDIVKVTGVKLNKNTLTLTVGGSETLTAAVEPDNASNKEVIWESSNADVASVENGRVTAKKAGTANITAVSAENHTMKASCAVTVNAAQNNPVISETKVKSVTLNVKKLTLGLKESYTLKATVNPSGVKNKKVTWKSDKPKIVSVKNGKLKALKTGKAKITVTSAADKTKKKTITVTVKKAPVKNTKVTLNKKNVTLKLKGKSKTFQIKPKVASKYGSATFKYTIDKKGKKAVKVDKNGKVTAKKKGKAVITVKTYNGKAKAVLKVTVK